MATVTMGSPNTDYVSKKAFYWTVGILTFLVLVLLFAMSPNRDRNFSGTSDTGATLSQPINSGTPGTATETNTNMNATQGTLGTQDTLGTTTNRMGTSDTMGTTGNTNSNTDSGTTTNNPGSSNTTDLKPGVETQ